MDFVDISHMYSMDFVLFTPLVSSLLSPLVLVLFPNSLLIFISLFCKSAFNK